MAIECIECVLTHTRTIAALSAELFRIVGSIRGMENNQYFHQKKNYLVEKYILWIKNDTNNCIWRRK